ncbi:MAG TPA: hypothetical protein VNQ90_04765 [Chthoniobacteraceae bacterium]|nr:hypothetical protein [Chthoniobacteraceae bacterium]
MISQDAFDADRFKKEIELWTERRPDGSVALDLNGKTRVEMSREDAVHLAWLLISPPNRSIERQSGDSSTVYLSVDDDARVESERFANWYVERQARRWGLSEPEYRALVQKAREANVDACLIPAFEAFCIKELGRKPTPDPAP